MSANFPLVVDRTRASPALRYPGRSGVAKRGGYACAHQRTSPPRWPRPSIALWAGACPDDTANSVRRDMLRRADPAIGSGSQCAGAQGADATEIGGTNLTQLTGCSRYLSRDRPPEELNSIIERADVQTFR
jgi:hypothetical protein